jgi:hypothetical protein
MPMYARVSMLGVNVDIDPADLPPSVWSDVTNMVPKSLGMTRARGYEAFYGTPLAPPFFVLYTPQAEEVTWLYAGSITLTTINQTGVHTDRTPAGMVATAGGNWTGGNLNGIAVVNAPQNPPYYWRAGMALALPLPGLRSNTQYRALRPFKYHLVGMGVVGTGGNLAEAVHWSNAADPGEIPNTWVPAPDNEAGDNILADEDGDIIDGMALRDSFYIYKQDSVYEMTYIGGNEVFRFRKVFATVGVLAKNCIARVQGTHVVLGNGDVYQHDGQNQKSLMEGIVREKFFSTLDDAYYKNSFVVYLEALDEVWFCVPTTGNTRANLCAVWHVTTGKWGYRTIPPTDHGATGIIGQLSGAVSEPWDSDTGTWNTDTTAWVDQSLSITEDSLLLASSQPSQLYKGNSGTTADGVAYSSQVSRLGLSLEDPSREKAIRRIWPRLNAPTGTTFTLELFNQRDTRDGQEVLGSVNFQTGNEGVAVNVNARYLGLKISTEESVDWNITGFDIEYMPQGFF